MQVRRLIIAMSVAALFFAPLRPALAASSPALCRVLLAAVKNAASSSERAARQKQLDSRCKVPSASPPPPATPASTIAAGSSKAKSAAPAKPQTRSRKTAGKKQKLRRVSRLDAVRVRSAPMSITVSAQLSDPLGRGISDAINRVADGGTIRLRPGRYASPGAIYKTVNIVGVVDKYGTRPMVVGKLSVFSSTVSLTDLDIEQGSEVGNPRIVDVGSGAVLTMRSVSLLGYSCKQDRGIAEGALTVNGGTAQLSNVVISAGGCYALATINGTVVLNSSSFWSNAEYVIIQSGGNFNDSYSKFYGNTIINIFGNAKAVMIGSTIDHIVKYSWWYSQDQTNGLRVAGLVIVTH